MKLNYQNIKNEVNDYISEFASDFDIDSIMDDIRNYAELGDIYINSIDDIDSSVFIGIIESNELR